MIRSLLAACVLVFPLLASAQTTARPLPPAPPGLQIEDVVIGKTDGRPLHAAVVTSTTPSAAPRAALLCVHGGGWCAGDYQGFIPLAYDLARRGGFVTVSVDYRLSQEAKWPAQIEDCKLAVRWLRANAAKYNIDPNKIGAVGHSAGGHLVACMGTMNDPKFDVGDYAGVSSKVQAVSDWSGPADITAGSFALGSGTITPEMFKKDEYLLNELIGFPYTARPDLWKEASPIMWIKANDPPFQIVHGENDEIVSISQGTGFAAALKKAGVPVDLVIIKNGTHGLGGPKGGPKADPDHDELMKKVVGFFDHALGTGK